MPDFEAREQGKRTTKGFTLVELLIALVVLGILAGALLLVSSAGADKAQAMRVVSDLRNLKAAAVQYNASSGSWPSSVTDLSGYLDGPLECSGPVCYEVASSEAGNFVGFKADLARVSSGVKDRLKGMAETVSLYSDTALANLYAGQAEAVYPVGYAGSGAMAASGSSAGTDESSGSEGSSGSDGGSAGESGGSSVPVGTTLTFSATNPLDWNVPSGALVIAPTPSGARVQPGSGWIIKGFDSEGKQVVNLTSTSGFLLIYKGADGTWYVQKKQGEQPVQVAKLEVNKIS